MFTDWMGQEVQEGDYVLYPATLCRSTTCITLGTYEGQYDDGALRIFPVANSLKKYGTTYFVDSRTGRRIKNVFSDEHLVSDRYWLHKPTGDKVSSFWERYDNIKYRPPVDEDWEYHPTQFADHVYQEHVVKPVRISVTKNVVRFSPPATYLVELEQQEGE